MKTSLERALEGEAAASPLDALRLARTRWLESGRLDMGALARELRVSRATLYRWVGSKERLIGEILWTFAERAIADARAQAGGSGAAFLAEATERYMRGALQFEPLMRFVQDDPEYALRVLASKHSPMQRRSIAAMREQLSQEVEAGNLRPPLPLDDLAYVIVRIVESYLYSDVIAGRDPDIAGGVAAIHALLLAPPVPARDCSAQRDRALAA